ncbi:MAG: antibiotic biosynthesis monooxygenase [Desulforhopalus sp.]
MIRTTLKLHGNPSKRKEILQTLVSISELKFNAQGCLKTEIYRDLDDIDIFYLFSDWATEKDLEECKQSKFMAVLRGLQFLLVDDMHIDLHSGITRNEKVDRKRVIRGARQVKDLPCIRRLCS